jgi:hypothetical protein
MLSMQQLISLSAGVIGAMVLQPPDSGFSKFPAGYRRYDGLPA